ncbi:FAD binding domain-containing protein [Anaeroselena agilis]|uniref:Xanthine dehydrogenase family protein subunit M n=1 Tax=Anaeroselena agilis TaxID=3063788 RepID=A0ABU3P2Q0_9FIRM|nr:xanthine dehydrogenase family protein subunit M [Selenomonadales bacterium 4137-cl]
MSYTYHAPRSIAELMAVMAEKKDGAMVLAGGTDVMVEIRAGHTPQALVDITKIADLNGIRSDGDTIHIGPTTTFTAIVESPIIREAAFVLAQAAASVGSPQIRNRGTVGGNIVNASPAADSVPALVALDAGLRLLSPAGERTLGIEEFLVGVGQTAILPGEVLVDISFPALAPKTGSAFIKLGRRKALAISRISAAAIIGYDDRELMCTDCRIAVGAVAQSPFRVRTAENIWKNCSLTRNNRDACVQAALQEISVTLGQRASAAYKKQAGPAIIRRAVDAALGQVFGGWEQVL